MKQVTKVTAIPHKRYAITERVIPIMASKLAFKDMCKVACRTTYIVQSKYDGAILYETPAISKADNERFLSEWLNKNPTEITSL